MLRNGSGLPLVGTRADHKEVCERPNLAKIEDESIGSSLFFYEPGDAQREVERRQDLSHPGGIWSEGTALTSLASR